MEGEQRLAAAGRAGDQSAGAALEAAAEDGVQLGDAARHHLAAERLSVLGPGQAREHPHAAGLDREVVEAAAVACAAVLDDPEPAALGAVGGGELLEQHNAV